MIHVEKIISFNFDQNCYLVYDENKNGFLVDPGFDTLKILKKIEELNVNAGYILLTHCHYDHIFSVSELRGHKKLVCGEKCSENIGSLGMNLSAGIGSPFTVAPADIIVSDESEFIIGDMKIRCIASPGHTDCGFCYMVEDMLFSGDTLFLRNVGRWDLPSGDENTLKKSIREKLFSLPDNTRVLCGHGGDTTIGYEKKYNFYVGA